MRLFFALMLLSGLSASAADVYVNPYVNQNGTLVQGYHRTEPDHNLLNNYSAQGNVNPYTGKEGTVNPYNTNTKNWNK